MLVATLLGIYFIPTFYVWLQRMAERRSPLREAPHEPPTGGGNARPIPGSPRREA